MLEYNVKQTNKKKQQEKTGTKDRKQKQQCQPQSIKPMEMMTRNNQRTGRVLSVGAVVSLATLSTQNIFQIKKGKRRKMQQSTQCCKSMKHVYTLTSNARSAKRICCQQCSKGHTSFAIYQNPA
jgi:hypothetical protein